MGQQPELTDESIRGAPATEPLVPVVAPLAAEPVAQGRAFGNAPGCETTGEPAMLGTLGRDAAFGLVGLTAPGIADWVGRLGRLAVPGIVVVPAPGVCPTVPVRPGAGFAGATPAGADPGDNDGAVAVPVGAPLEIPDETPDDDPVDDPVPVL